MKPLLIIVLCFVLTSSFGQTIGDLRPTVTMKEYVDMKVESLEQMNNLRDEHQKEISRIKEDQIKTAYASQDKRLDGMNEFRQALKDSNATYITRSELIAWVVAAMGLFWGWSRHQREQKESQGRAIVSGDKVEVKK